MINKKVAAVADAVREVLLQTESVSKKHKEAHEKNMDAAQREMDRRHEDGEDMTGAKIHPTTYEITKPKSKMKEELSPKQKKIAALAGDPNKIDAADFKKLRGESTEHVQAAKSLFSRIMEKVAERELDEAFPTVADVHKRANAPQSRGSAGVKRGTRYGGGRQPYDVEPEEDGEKKPFTRMSGAHKNRRVDTKDYKKEDMDLPWDGPSTKTKGDVKDKSGAVHTPASRAKDSAQKGMKTFAQKRKELDETLSKKAPPADWIHDFVHSDNPKFAGKSKEKRQKMAIAAYYAKQRNEEADCVTPPQAKKIAKKEVKGHEKTMHHNEEVEGLDEVSADLANKVRQARYTQATASRTPETLSKMKSATSSYTKRSSAERAKASQSDINKGFASDAAANRKKGLSNEEYELDEGRGPTTQVDEPFVTSDSKPLQNAKDLAKSTMKRIKTEMMGKTGTSE
jgi:hypothetical protein